MLTIAIEREEEKTGNETSVIHTRLTLWTTDSDGVVHSENAFRVTEHPAIMFKLISEILAGIQEPVDIICEVLGVNR